jgi:hypothetical protein
MIYNVTELAFFRTKMMASDWMFLLFAIAVSQATQQQSCKESISSNVSMCQPILGMVSGEECF